MNRTLALMLLVLTVGSYCLAHPVDAAEKTVGNTTPGSTWRTPGANYKFGTIVEVLTAGTTTSMSWSTRGAGAEQRFIPCIYYIDSSGLPAGLFVKGNEVKVTANQPAGRVVAPLPAVAITPGRYLLTLLSGPTSNGASNATSIVTGAGYYNPNNYPNPSTTFGVASREDYQWSFALTYQEAAPPVLEPPVNTMPPSVAGVLVAGETLTGSIGAWTGNPPPTFTYQWWRCASSVCTTTGQTTLTYPTGPVDVGAALKFVVRGTNSIGSADAEVMTGVIAPASPVVKQPLPLRIIVDPSTQWIELHRRSLDFTVDGLFAVRIDVAVGTTCDQVKVVDVVAHSEKPMLQCWWTPRPADKDFYYDASACTSAGCSGVTIEQPTLKCPIGNQCPCWKYPADAGCVAP